jgi:hypothetical protein
VHRRKYRPRQLRPFSRRETLLDGAQRLFDKLEKMRFCSARAVLRGKLDIGQGKADQPAKIGGIGMRAPAAGLWRNPGADDPEVRRFAIGRLQQLERMGLATAAGPGQWMVALEAERTLRDLGMRGDIIKTMHRAFTERGQDRGIADYVIDSGTASSPFIGRLVASGLHDELTGEAYAVIDGTDGRTHLLLRVADALDFRIEWLVAEDELSRRLHALIPAASIAVKSLFPRLRR